MGRRKKQKKHIIFYDPEIGRKLNEVKKAEGITYDELLRRYLKLPEDFLQTLQRQHVDIGNQLTEEYKDERLGILMGVMWILISKCALGEYDINIIRSVIETDIRFKKYLKK